MQAVAAIAKGHLDMNSVSNYSGRMNDSVQHLPDDHGERTAVVLPISAYEKLLEDLEDLAVAVERRNEPTIPHEQLVTELKCDGLA
jgi:hypothetical protein